jgi:SAM-dependent methyltransferase
VTGVTFRRATQPRSRPPRTILCAIAASGCLVSTGVGQARRDYIELAEARPLLALPARLLPANLPSLVGAGAEARWRAWIAQHDAEIRQRLRAGDEDTLLNWLLLGRSFTSLRPVTAVRAEIPARVDALTTALQMPGGDERRIFARRFLEERGVRVDTPADRTRARAYLLAAVDRMIAADTARAQTRSAGTSAPASAFVERGLSLDTSLQPNFAVDRALAAAKARGHVAAASVRRVAVVGAGLDFADKNTGFDFYPVQTVQPFAVLDSLRRHGLVAPGRVEVLALDISARVLDHVASARAAAPRGYVVRLPLAPAPWTGELRRYWSAFGDQIGSAVPGAAPAGMEMRAVRLSAEAVSALATDDVNVIVARSARAPFDLVIATNVLVYYGAFDQALAMANIASMLAPDGLFMTNTTLPDVPGSGLGRAGSQVTLYTSDGRGDEVIWYQRRR